MESTLVDSPVKGDGKLLELPNGLHQRQENGVREKQQARVFSRKRTRDVTPESLPKKSKLEDEEQKLPTQEERVNNLLGRTADILLVLAGLAQIRGGRTPSELEKQLASDAQSNLSSLVSKVVPGTLLTKGNAFDGMLGTLGFVKRADGSLEPAPRLQEAENPEESDSDESSGSISGKDDGAQIQSGLLTSPSALSLDDDTELELKQGDEFEEFEDEQSQGMRHRQLAKLVQQLKAESFVPQPVPEVTNAYMITVVPCEVCQALVKDTGSVVVCDGCEKAYHSKCLPQLHFRELPRVDWCCPRCNGVKPKYGPVNKAASSGTPNKMPVRKPEYSRPGSGAGAAGVSSSSPAGAAAVSSSALANGPEMNSINTSNSNNLMINNNSSSGSSIKRVEVGDGFKAQQMVKPAEAAGVAAAATPPPQGTLHVDWVGEVQRVVNRKAYYGSCVVGGWTYKLQDCALFRPETPETPPYIARLQALWEDLDTGSKWVRVNWLYYPSDMPAAIAGRPETVEADEVFETNHSDNNLVGSIQGPCQVLNARRYHDEKERRGKLSTGDLPPVFLCKWVYDAQKGEFRKAPESS